jgi:hypothetical protein
MLPCWDCFRLRALWWQTPGRGSRERALPERLLVAPVVATVSSLHTGNTRLIRQLPVGVAGSQHPVWQLCKPLAKRALPVVCYMFLVATVALCAYTTGHHEPAHAATRS